MPRPKKCRKVCCLPKAAEFTPSGCAASKPAVILSVDEYETIRLIDREGFSQEECGEFMQVARATVQQIYTSARSKLAEALVSALPLKIEGGDYRLCDRSERAGSQSMNPLNTFQENFSKFREENIMKIAVTYENGTVFQHFGHTEQFKLYEVENGAVSHTEIVDTNGSGHGALAGFLLGKGVDTLICGGIGGGAQMALKDAGIRLFGGVSGDADAAVNALLSDSLAFNPDVACNHHEHSHGHSCHSHGCGEHSCHS
ncbi:DUF134 domain-containing protein [Clostridiaceae bacterium]|nr:DUF134 domain-containing protein [Clostridiaceae bacterium]